MVKSENLGNSVKDLSLKRAIIAGVVMGILLPLLWVKLLLEYDSRAMLWLHFSLMAPSYIIIISGAAFSSLWCYYRCPRCREPWSYKKKGHVILAQENKTGDNGIEGIIEESIEEYECHSCKYIFKERRKEWLPKEKTIEE